MLDSGQDLWSPTLPSAFLLLLKVRLQKLSALSQFTPTAFNSKGSFIRVCLSEGPFCMASVQGSRRGWRHWGQVQEKEEPAQMFLLSLCCKWGQRPFPLNSACRSVTNFPLSPKLIKTPQKQKPQQNKTPQTTSKQLQHFVLEGTKIVCQLKLNLSVNKYIPLPCIPPKIC